MKQLFLVMLGSALGGGLRYGVACWLKSLGTFPWATFAVNIVGCLLIGVFSSLPWAQMNPQTRLLLTTGFCGGFTTFSTFANESLGLFEGGHAVYTILYICASVVLGLLACGAGHALGKAFC